MVAAVGAKVCEERHLGADGTKVIDREGHVRLTCERQEMQHLAVMKEGERGREAKGRGGRLVREKDILLQRVTYSTGHYLQ